MKYLILILIASNVYVSEECELSDEYKTARNEAAKIVYGSKNDYKKCLNAVIENEYWKAFSKCKEAGDGKNVGGGCAHLVNRGSYSSAVDSSHCDSFKFEPSKKLAEKLLQEMVQEKNIVKCKN